jgi:hypothetical protein
LAGRFIMIAAIAAFSRVTTVRSLTIAAGDSAPRSESKHGELVRIAKGKNRLERSTECA